MNNSITIRDFLLFKTAVHELCVILDNGYLLFTCYIDNEDLFIHGIPKEFLELNVLKEYKGALNTSEGTIIVHYIETERR